MGELVTQKYRNDSEELDMWIRACYMDPQPSCYYAPAADSEEEEEEELEGKEYQGGQKTNILEALEETKQFVSKLLGEDHNNGKKMMDGYDSCGGVRKAHQPELDHVVAVKNKDGYVKNKRKKMDDCDSCFNGAQERKRLYHVAAVEKNKKMDFMWEQGLACPSLDEYAFNFQVEPEPMPILNKSLPPRNKNNPPHPSKGKELKIAILALKPTSEHIKTQVEPILKKSLPAALNRTRADEKQYNKGKADNDCQLLIDNKGKADNDLRLEATRHKLHESYQRIREAKQQKNIQVIDFKKPIMEQPKPKGKPNLRQKLLAMGKSKTYKKFQSLLY